MSSPSPISILAVAGAIAPCVVGACPLPSPIMGLLSTTLRFQTTLTVRAPVARVKAVVPDAPSFIRLNPLVLAAEPTREDPNRYRITDQLSILGLSYRVHYEARVLLTEDGFSGEVFSPGGITGKNQFRFIARGEETFVQEDNEMTGPPLLVHFAVRTARPAHQRILEALKARAEAVPT